MALASLTSHLRVFSLRERDSDVFKGFDTWSKFLIDCVSEFLICYFNASVRFY